MSDDTPNWLARARAAWVHRGQARPDFARVPGPGQESVWDYPRPPALVADTRAVSVYLGDHRIAVTRAAWRLLETASPPTLYIPWSDIDDRVFERSSQASFCEWKGRAVYWDLVDATARRPAAAWGYPDAQGDYGALADAVAFYPDRVACFINGERVRAQAGGFYGGWVTDEIVGPYKGEPGTGGW